MSKYVIATTAHLTSAHSLSPDGHRLSLDGTQMVHEIEDSNHDFDACPDCHVFSHQAALTHLNKQDSKGVWRQDDL